MPHDMLAEAGASASATQLTPAQEFEKAETLHKLLRLALDDFEAVLDDPRYLVHFNHWHAPVPERRAQPGQITAVCLAGAVVAKRLGGRADLITDGFGYRLHALNFLRAGCIFEAAFAVRFADYANSDRQFSKTPMAHAAVRLEEHWAPILQQFVKERRN
jgi:hypothetical protein